MFNLKNKIVPASFLLVLLLGLFNLAIPSQALAAPNLSGRILLQVEGNGEAWYVNPLDNYRYYLGRPDDAYKLMRFFGLGATNVDINLFLRSRAPSRLAGRILLKVQDKGQAYYVNPLDLKLYYLGRPEDAFSLMRAQALGISNKNLDIIPIASASLFIQPGAISTTSPSYSLVKDVNTYLARFSFRYRQEDYEIVQALSPSIYESYRDSLKNYSYRSDSPPLDLREAFYSLFLKIKTGDDSLDNLIRSLKSIAVKNSWSDDELLEFTLALVQYIPYDEAKIGINNANTNPYFPYETLYLNKGVCSDKTFLAVALLRKLGYGAAILDFPEINHSALGLACPPEYSVAQSGYCYVETTNYFPPGVIPQSIANGQAQLLAGSTNFFNEQGLGKIEIYQKSGGKIYQGMIGLIIKIENWKTSQLELDNQRQIITSSEAALEVKAAELAVIKKQLDDYYANSQIKEYNSLVITYNQLVNKYNEDLRFYRADLEKYNLLVSQVNLLSKDFYQQ